MNRMDDQSDEQKTGICRFAQSRMQVYYEPKLKKYGNSARAVGWISRESQLARFEAACDVGDLSGCSILDAGCGVGHFYGVLRDKIQNFSYVGVDISSSMINAALQYFPGARFVKGDVLTYTPAEVFDYAVTVGPYNVEVQDNDEIMCRMIEKMFTLTRKGIAVSMTWGGTTGNAIHFFDADTMVAFCRRLSNHVFLRKNHQIGDIMLYLYHNDTEKPPMKETAGYERPLQC